MGGGGRVEARVNILGSRTYPGVYQAILGESIFNTWLSWYGTSAFGCRTNMSSPALVSRAQVDNFFFFTVCTNHSRPKLYCYLKINVIFQVINKVYVDCTWCTFMYSWTCCRWEHFPWTWPSTCTWTGTNVHWDALILPWFFTVIRPMIPERCSHIPIRLIYDTCVPNPLVLWYRGLVLYF